MLSADSAFRFEENPIEPAVKKVETVKIFFINCLRFMGGIENNSSIFS